MATPAAIPSMPHVDRRSPLGGTVNQTALLIIPFQIKYKSIFRDNNSRGIFFTLLRLIIRYDIVDYACILEIIYHVVMLHQCMVNCRPCWHLIQVQAVHWWLNKNNSNYMQQLKMYSNYQYFLFIHCPALYKLLTLKFFLLESAKYNNCRGGI